MSSLTPVGDYLRRRYPPHDGATHYLGSGDGDPGCCAGPHPACTYDSGWREALRVLREFAEREHAVIPVHDPATGAHVGYVPFNQVLDDYMAARADGEIRAAVAQLAEATPSQPPSRVQYIPVQFRVLLPADVRALATLPRELNRAFKRTGLDCTEPVIVMPARQTGDTDG